MPLLFVEFFQQGIYFFEFSISGISRTNFFSKCVVLLVAIICCEIKGYMFLFLLVPFDGVNIYGF